MLVSIVKDLLIEGIRLRTRGEDGPGWCLWLVLSEKATGDWGGVSDYYVGPIEY